MRASADLRRPRAGERLAGLGGVALLVSTFLPWYAGTSVLNAWQALGFLDLLLGLTGTMGVLLAVFAATRRAPALPVATSVLLTTLACIVLLLIAYRLLDQPGPDDAVDVRVGAYLGVASVLAVAVGAWRALTDEHEAVPATPAPPARPAPPPVDPTLAAPGPAGDPRAS